jgi:hypothetical protein
MGFRAVGLVVRVSSGDHFGEGTDGRHTRLWVPAVAYSRPGPQGLRDPTVLVVGERAVWVIG